MRQFLKRNGGTLLEVVVLALALALASRWLGGFGTFVLSLSLTYGILAITLDIQWGQTGILNLGIAGPFGVGAYGYALLTTKTSVGPGSAAALSILGVAVAGFLVAFSAFRRNVLPLYVGLLTLALSLVLEKIASVSYRVTGGANGVYGFPDLSWLTGWMGDSLSSDQQILVVVGAITLLIFGVAQGLVRSRVGTLLRAIREDEMRVSALGYDTALIKAVVVGFASAGGALAGVLYAGMQGIVTPSLLGSAFSVQVFVWVAVGGTGTIIGPLVAACLLTTAQSYLSGAAAQWYLVALGSVFVLIVVLLPRGLAGLIRGNRFALRRPLGRGPAVGVRSD